MGQAHVTMGAAYLGEAPRRVMMRVKGPKLVEEESELTDRLEKPGLVAAQVHDG